MVLAAVALLSFGDAAALESGPVNAVSWSANELQLGVAYETGQFAVHEVRSGKLVFTDRLPKSVKTIVFEPPSPEWPPQPRAGKFVAGGSGGHLAFYRETAGRYEKLWQTQVPAVEVNAAAFSHDFDWIAVTTAPDGIVRFLDAKSGVLRSSLFSRGNGMSGVAVLTNGITLATGGQTLVIWNLRAAEISAARVEPRDLAESVLIERSRKSTMHPGVVGWTTSVSPVPNKQQAVVTCIGGPEDQGRPLTVAVIDALEGKVLRVLGKAEKHLHSVSVRPTSGMVAAAGDQGVVQVWDHSTGELLKTLTPGLGPIAAVSYSPYGRKLAIASRSGVVVVLDADTYQEQLRLTNRQQNGQRG